MDCKLVFHVFKDIYLNVIMQIQYIILKKMAHALCYDAFVDVFVNEEFKISL